MALGQHTASGPTCAYGHGLLTSESGWWALTGVEPAMQNALTSPFALAPKGDLAMNGKGYTVQVWRCPTCGNVQLFDVSP